jgi:endonuclease/exonuclease/phosphatase family metal-dependent hydrolase
VTRLRVLTWNLNWHGGQGTIERKLAALRDIDWDVGCLQEVGRAAWTAIQDQPWFADVAHGCDLSEWPAWKNPHGAALVARGDTRLVGCEALDGTHLPGRGVTAVVEQCDARSAICSWHAPNAAGDGPVTKMDGYRALVAWAGAIEGPCVVGADTNHWSRSVSLEPPDVQPSNDPWSYENEFFGSTPPHRLRDALTDALGRDRERYAAAVAARPEGPLEVSYKRGTTEDRFDYILVSPEVEVVDCQYDYRAGVAAGSDHGHVVATLAIR